MHTDFEFNYPSLARGARLTALGMEGGGVREVGWCRKMIEKVVPYVISATRFSRRLKTKGGPLEIEIFLLRDLTKGVGGGYFYDYRGRVGLYNHEK